MEIEYDLPDYWINSVGSLVINSTTDYIMDINLIVIN